MNKKRETYPGYKDVQDALDMGYFIPFFHPLHDATTGSITGAEVLARLHHPEYGISLPSTFMQHLAGDLCMARLTQILLKKVGNWLERTDLPENFWLTFNIPADMLCDTGLPDICRELKAQSRGKIIVVIEITEDKPLFISSHALRQGLLHLANAGVLLAIDDFGTGFSGLHTLQRTDARIIKIPREFIGTVDVSEKSLRIVENIIHLAGSLELQLIAEGVETESQASLLSDRGVKLMQGFYYSHPLCEFKFTDYLRSPLSKDKTFLPKADITT